MYLLYLSVWKIIGLLPEKIAYQVANFVSDIAYRRDGRKVKRLRSNYKRVLPELSEAELAKLSKEKEDLESSFLFFVFYYFSEC
jgi:KDO2-lipid IV(A) lauroyltransferase